MCASILASIPSRGGLTFLVLCALTSAGWLVVPPRAEAAVVRGRASTLLGARDLVRAGEAVADVPLLELLSFEVSELGVPGAEVSRVVMQGWGRLQLGADQQKGHEADLGLLFFDGRFGDLSLRLGRQHLIHGVGRMALVDGLDLSYHLPAGISVEAFAGANVHRLFQYRTGDWQAGGRISKRLPGPGEVGLAYRQQLQNSDLLRGELGIDAWYSIAGMDWLAVVVFDPGSARLVEGRLNGRMRIDEQWTVALDGERSAPDLLLPATSIFSVFSEAAHDAAGGEVSWEPSPYYQVELRGHGLLLDNEWLGYRATLRATTFRDPGHRSRVAAEISRLDEQENGYQRVRLFTVLQINEPMRITADAYAYRYNQPVNAGIDWAALAQASVVYDLSDSMRVAATVGGGSTPYAETQVEAMLRFAYGYDLTMDTELVP